MESSGNETDAAYGSSVMVERGLVNKREVPVCLKLQYLLAKDDALPRVPLSQAAFDYERRGEPLQSPPWPGNLPHASAKVS